LLGFAALLNTVLGLAQLRGGTRTRVALGRYELWIALALAALSLFGNLASATAIQTLSASLLNVLQRGEVLVVALLAWAMLGERVERRYWLGSMIAGVGLVVLRDPFGAGPVDPRGTGFALLSVLCFSTMAVVTRMAIQRVDPVRVNALRLWMTLPLWFVVAGAPAELASIPRTQLAYAALAAFAGPFAARLCLILSARYVDARVTTLGVLSAPVISLGLELLILGDAPPAHELLGGAIMLAGIAVPLLRRRVPAQAEGRSSPNTETRSP
jgi:drug/metabolite transporter (DMT)-like permease